MRDTRKTVKFDVIAGGELAQYFVDLASQAGSLLKTLFKALDRTVGTLEQAGYFFIALDIIGYAAFMDLAQTVLQRLNQKLATFRVVQQIILKVWIATYDPDVAQHLIQHAG